jgi:hypothetical protein
MSLFLASIRKAAITDVVAVLIIIATGAMGYWLIPMVSP